MPEFRRLSESVVVNMDHFVMAESGMHAGTPDRSAHPYTSVYMVGGGEPIELLGGDAEEFRVYLQQTTAVDRREPVAEVSEGTWRDRKPLA